MDRATAGFRAEAGFLPPNFDPSVPGPLDRSTALALLRQADDLLDASEPDRALALYARALGMPDRDVSAAALFGMGNALYRLDRDDEALQAWQKATELGETPVAYRAWRQVAAALVRSGDLRRAFEAYRECERLAPREDRPEIASRLGWLAKETGNSRAAGRYFARSRGDALQPFLTYALIAVTSVTSIVAMGGSRTVQGGVVESQLLQLLQLDKVAVAHGELWRLFTVTLVHDPTNLLHLLFNMYALYLAGVIVERMYGPVLFALFYVLAALGGSTASLVFGDSVLAVGASGAIFGLFGIVFVAMRAHHPVLDRQSRSIAAQMGFLILVNLGIGFGLSSSIDNAAHVGGLLAGLWLGFVIPPAHVATLAAFWQGARPGRVAGPSLVLTRAVAILALVAVIGVGVVMGIDRWSTYEAPAQPQGFAVPPAVTLVAGMPPGASTR